MSEYLRYVAHSSDKVDRGWFLLALKYMQAMHVKSDGAPFSPKLFSVLLFLYFFLSAGASGCCSRV